MTNRAHWLALLPVVTAYAQGKKIEIEIFPGGEFAEVGNSDEDAGICFNSPPDSYRIASEFRPYDPSRDEIPLHIMVRFKNAPKKHSGIIVLTRVFEMTSSADEPFVDEHFVDSHARGYYTYQKAFDLFDRFDELGNLSHVGVPNT